MLSLLVSLFSTVAAASSSTVTSFLSIGDWGGYNLGGYHRTNVEHVATQMYTDIQSNNYSALLNTGDNFYYCGIQDLNDENIQPDYIRLFSKISLPWISSLGNHDYGYNVTAQLELSSKISNWVMPARYYKHTYDDGVVFVLDTSPCIQSYRNDDPAGWDPCGTEYPDCTPYPSPAPPCRFHENIVSQLCSTQTSWLKRELDTLRLTPGKWVIMVGHHPVYEIDDTQLVSLIDTYADLYINGHAHLLATYTRNQHSKYITSGAGSMVYAGATLNTTMYDWHKQTSGYTRHHIQAGSILTEFIDSDGTIIHTSSTQFAFL